MTSSSVCQGLQSCLEPLLVEPRVLRLNLAPSKSIICPSIPASSEPHNKENKTNTIRETNNKNNDFSDDMKSDKSEDTGGWSFLQCLSKETAAAHKKEYVHPLVKRSASMLSEKSLEMCTESLGSETGSQNSYHDMITADTMLINNNTRQS
ncbi:hypothetical protein CUMW_053990 [Citrus unshiu]|nr:hypothetical protein CUMW_053990 [Citrus unshiu]